VMDFYATDIITQYWPVDGPHVAVTTIEAGRALAELVRFLNHATGPGHRRSAMPYANVANSLIGFLHSAVASMPQLLGQLSEFLEEQATDPTLYDDRRGTPKMPADDTARTAAAVLREATHRANHLASALNTAGQHTTHLGNDDGPVGES